MATDLTVAQTIADQIGGGAFFMMGTKQKFADEKSLLFDIRGCKKYNKIRVTLQADDTYLVEFIKIGRAPKYNVSTKQAAGIYAEDLRPLIERETGLALVVPRVRGINA